MRALQRLVRNGNATAVNIPRAMLITAGWLPGEFVVVEMLEDKTFRLRRPCERDIAPHSAPKLLLDEPVAAKP